MNRWTTRKRFDPNQPRDEDGKWKDALASLLAEVEGEQEGTPYPQVDQYASWDSISYGGEVIQREDVQTGNLSSSLATRADPTEIEAMNDYVVYDGETLAINRLLRSGQPLNAEQERRNEQLDRVASRASLSRDVDFWRAASLTEAQYQSLSPGSVMRDPGYASASPSQEVAEYYGNTRSGGTGRDVVFTIRGRQGDPIIPVRSDEWVIPRGTELRVISRNGNVVEVEYT